MSERSKPAPRETWGELGAALRALPNERWRQFVYHYVTGKPGHGGAVRAYRAAGFGKGQSALNQAREAHKLLHDDRIIAAISEESKKFFRAALPEAVLAARDIIADPAHKDRARVAMALIERADPVVSHHQIGVTHRIIDPDQEALEELKALRQLGTDRTKLLELFGPNGLDRLEALETVDLAKRAAAAKVVDAEIIEIEPEPDDTEAAEAEVLDVVPPQGEPDPEMLGDEF
jgi:hypothetical protein